jgi:hypothetical protein
MAYPISAGIEISINGSTWYKLTDHNRQAIDITPEVIEISNRMANGKLRKYVVAKKNKISTSWSYLPTKTSELVDGYMGPAWLESFYNANIGVPIHVKVVSSGIYPEINAGQVPSNLDFESALTGNKTCLAFITSFSNKIIHRTKKCDYVEMSIEFTEI